MSASLPLSASERRLRNLSVSGLLLAVAITGAALYAGWWKPWSAAHARTEQLAQRQSRAQTLLATADDTHAALMQAEGLARQQPLWLPLADPAQAIDTIAGQVDQAVALVGDDGQRCKVQSRNPVDAAAATGRLARAGLTIRLRCGNSEWLQLAHILESGQPPLLIDDVAISAPTQYPGAIIGPEAGVLDISFTISAFLSPGTPVAVEAAP